MLARKAARKLSEAEGAIIPRSLTLFERMGQRVAERLLARDGHLQRGGNKRALDAIGANSIFFPVQRRHRVSTPGIHRAVRVVVFLGETLCVWC